MPPSNGSFDPVTNNPITKLTREKNYPVKKNYKCLCMIT